MNSSVYISNLSSNNFGLQLSALNGDREGIQKAIDAGANVNAIDASGRSALMCTIAGTQWSDISVSYNEAFMTPSRLKAIDILIRQPEISLFTLNAPQHAFNDATPLGMAAWLNLPDAVRTLLENNLSTVAVDGTDTYGSTPLMYAARDGHLEIVVLLLQHGARPDLRALNYRTAIQYALSHPRVLYLCETMLRQHRVHEWKLTDRSGALADSEHLLRRAVSSFPAGGTLDTPPSLVFSSSLLSKTTDTILQHIRSDDIEALCSTLFATQLPPSTCPPLINHKDENGWSPIHHSVCVSEPSVRVLDTLYCAGADVALFTEHEHYTALHCFAFSDHVKCSPETLYHYISHLVHDLRAPLSAQDKNGDTCIHIAASRGRSIEVLQVLLKFDPSHSVRDLCNAEGLTAWEVAKPEFRAEFGEDVVPSRPGSSLSTNTLRPVQYSIESYLEKNPTLHQRQISFAASDFDVSGAALQLIDDLRISSPSIHHKADMRYIKHLESLMTDMHQLQRTIIGHFHSRVKAISDALRGLEDDAQGTIALLNDARDLANTKMEEHGIQPLTVQPRVSEDSELTCVSERFSKSAPSIIIDPEPSEKEDTIKLAGSSTTSRFMAWIKRKSSANTLTKVSSPPPAPPKEDLQMEECDDKDLMRASIKNGLQTSEITFGAVGRDLQSIRECLDTSRQLLESAARSISRADRILKQALKARKAMISNLPKVEDDLFIRSSISLSAKSSLTSIISVSTMASRVSNGDESLSSGILAENDDEGTRAVRRLLLRKIEARCNGALDEVERAARWLGVVNDVVQGVKRRTYI